MAMFFGVGSMWSVSAFSRFLPNPTILGVQVYHASSSTSAQAIEFKNPNKAISFANFDRDNPEIPLTGKVVVTDLRSMIIYLYQDNQLVSSSTILAKGRPGSPWETPVGEYAVKTKELKHFSSIGKVWMPYSLQFFGNFFIHGWPYDSKGKAVARTYSGGCIRLADVDAKKVYDFVDNGTTVLVFGSDKKMDQLANVSANLRLSAVASSYLSLKDPDKMPMSAESYLVADVDTGEVVIEKNKDRILPIASISKLMTALVSLETLNQAEKTIVQPKAYKTYSKTGRLYLNEKILIGDLLYPLLLESSNMSAEALAQHHNRDSFIATMNEKAKSIGMKNTIYDDPSGLSENNVSTAVDLFKQIRYIYKYKKYILDITREPKRVVGKHEWRNVNSLYLLDNYLGGKNGYTDEAGRTLVALFELPLSEFEHRTVALILLKSENRKQDIAEIIRFLSNNVSRETKSAFTPSVI
ncbi:MAG: D-alanyl-D-alanine carboxypeptidase, penicillin binding protein 7 [Parcubacteria group bacterium GW2011_GWC1_43_11b]|nr:MAG: D-alanyl-D-alanine carboxypeptidase, penicillin binding protein 7 [Parcubacteria group bacterium GW2011_GWB1_42_9]KKS89174.1 MAG: D-alanyl-D-alanine carboxypeptidase, penicillin binding protein 7 [Parcubacteria group bacterium GW2011_GWC1_43_11b]KKT09576.1 MAG: D-alanyl-D-alanine carboxypeptidase, penicillin binding protein 7 [Parcubacteria group bacterium GW2011_GWA1_43_21]